MSRHSAAAPRTQLNLADFPQSPYAQERQRLHAGAYFAGPLEAEYVESHLQRVQRVVRVWLSLNAALCAAYTLEPLARVGLADAGSAIHLFLMLPCIALLTGCAWSVHYSRFYLSLARSLIPLYNLLVTIFIAVGLLHGRTEQLAALAVNLIGVFFFSGLLFRTALLVAAIMVSGFLASSLIIGLPTEMITRSMIVTVLTMVIGAVVGRDIEHSYRKSLLEGALIGELAARDALCGIMNRRTFDEHLPRVWQRALRERRSVSILLIDIDHFKQYNDSHGHQAGDVALRGVARAIQGFVRRPLDLASRFGGEEFAIILYDQPAAVAHDMAHSIRASIHGLNLAATADVPAAACFVTVSVGVGFALPTIGRTPHGAIQLADEALYEAKRAGRNRVVFKGGNDYQLLETGAFKAARLTAPGA